MEMPKICFTEQEIEQIHYLATIGLTLRQTAEALRIAKKMRKEDVKTLIETPEFEEHWSAGRMIGNTRLCAKTFEMAVEKENPSLLIFLAKARLQMRDGSSEIEVPAALAEEVNYEQYIRKLKSERRKEKAVKDEGDSSVRDSCSERNLSILGR